MKKLTFTHHTTAKIEQQTYGKTIGGGGGETHGNMPSRITQILLTKQQNHNKAENAGISNENKKKSIAVHAEMRKSLKES